MNTKNLFAIVAVVLSIFAIVVSVRTPKTIVNNVPRTVDTKNVGAFPGGLIFDNIDIRGNLTYGGGRGIATSTSATTYTFAKKDLENYTLIDLMENTGSATFTLPATSTMMSLLPGVGATRTWLIHNATTSASITLTLVAGAGMDLVAVTTNDDVIDPGEYTQLSCTQIPYRTADNENVVCIVDELTNAD